MPRVDDGARSGEGFSEFGFGWVLKESTHTANSAMHRGHQDTMRQEYKGRASTVTPTRSRRATRLSV